MKKITVDTHGHRVDIEVSYWNGRERITYNGQVVSDKKSFLFVSPHIFTVVEDGTNVVYEVNLLSGLFQIGFVVRRNGIAVASSS
ncbi:hypothetical protein MTX78_16620 [Hymenobacter tibetensis]|uniref:Uncharacterized protein n=1 Tax=Hymenobacter tibetensis TaxID=497967 RepID=A0ABY4CXI4_9BACT|nr:hypothetical protein [Hymenobacter tibetensis]UOG73736.1 hypothetical protein MTX78_16620 [Hymenobacter tibetensis]